MSDYQNTRLNLVSGSGGCGCVKLSLTGTTSTQLADHPCKEVWIAAANADDVILSLDLAATAATSIMLPQLAASDGDPGGEGYLRIPIDNTNRLYVLGENGDIVYYMYRA